MWRRGRRDVQWPSGLLVDGDASTEKGLHLAVMVNLLILCHLFHLVERLQQGNKGDGRRTDNIK